MLDVTPSPPTLDYGIEPNAQGISYVTDPAGGLHIDVRPPSFRRWLKVDTVAGVAGTIGVIIGGICVFVGPIIIWRIRHDPVIFIAYPTGAAALALMVGLYFASRPQHTRIDADRERLQMWVSGPFGPRSHQWRREQLETIEAKWTMKNTGEGDRREGGLQITAAGKTYVFLGFLPDEPVQQIAARLHESCGIER